MPIKTVTSRDFNQNVSNIKKESSQGPVFITDRGKPSHVLLSIKDYNKLAGTKENIVALLAMPEAAEIEFEVTQQTGDLFKPEDFS